MKDIDIMLLERNSSDAIHKLARDVVGFTKDYPAIIVDAVLQFTGFIFCEEKIPSEVKAEAIGAFTKALYQYGYDKGRKDLFNSLTSDHYRRLQ